MNLIFLFERQGVTVTAVANAAEVDPGTASRWKSGEREARWPQICKLYARGFLKDDDLRAAGLAIPRREELGTPSTPASPEAPEAA